PRTPSDRRPCGSSPRSGLSRPSSRRGRGASGAGHSPAARAISRIVLGRGDQLLDPRDDLVDRERGRVDRLRVVRGLELRPVTFVAEPQIGRERVLVDSGPLVRSALGTLRGVGDEEGLHVGSGGSNVADVYYIIER